jgi:hypothetical protein
VSSFDQHLEAARAAIAVASQPGDQGARKRAGRDFLRAVGRLAQALGQEATSGAALPAEVTAFVAETAPLLRRADGSLNLWIAETVDRQPEDDASYRLWLLDRSSIQAMVDLYRGSAADGYVGDFSVDDYDEAIRHRAPQFDPGARPSGLPDGHWWWSDPLAAG